jgi:hypothetical protein
MTYIHKQKMNCIRLPEDPQSGPPSGRIAYLVNVVVSMAIVTANGAVVVADRAFLVAGILDVVAALDVVVAGVIVIFLNFLSRCCNLCIYFLAGTPMV